MRQAATELRFLPLTICENTVPSIQLDICAHYVRSVTSVVPHENADAVPHTGNLTQIRQDKFVNVVGILKVEICIQSERILRSKNKPFNDNKFCLPESEMIYNITPCKGLDCGLGCGNY